MNDEKKMEYDLWEVLLSLQELSIKVKALITMNKLLKDKKSEETD